MAAVILLSAAKPARAFQFQEHAAIGDQAFTEACSVHVVELMRAIGEAYTDAERRDPATFCRSLLLPGRRTYGTVTAMSGDNIPSPYLFDDGLRRVEAVTVSSTDYLLQAHENRDHFQPDSVAAYKFWHRTALLAAFQGTSDKDPKSLRRKLEQVLILNAFADHFLADSFAAGHIRVDRKRLPDRVAKKLHDEDNKANAGANKWWVTNEIGETWWPVGDGKWDAMPDTDKRRIIVAVRKSIVEVIGVYLTVAPLVNDHPTDIQRWKEPPERGAAPQLSDLDDLRRQPILQSDEAFAALSLVPLRPSCAEQSVVGDAPCFRLTEYSEAILLGLAGNVRFTDRNNATSWSVDVVVPILSFFGVGVRADIHTDTRENVGHNTTIGQAGWLTGITPGVFARVLPSPSANHGFEFSYGMMVGYPILLEPDAQGYPSHLGSTSLKIPDIQFFIGRLFYALDVNLEFGYGSFIALRPGTDPAGPPTIGTERGAKIGLSTHYAFF